MFRRAMSPHGRAPRRGTQIAAASALATAAVMLPGLTARAAVPSADTAQCSDASDGLILGDFSDCFYVAATSSGQAVADATSALPAEIVITVTDNSTNSKVASCTGTGTGSFEVTCPYAETPGHEYEVTATDPTFNDVLVALVAAG